MGEDQPSPSYARRKHLRSSDNELDDEPKRRKHHHNRRHHRRHHHHSRHERYRNEEELEETISMQKRVEHGSHMKPVDDEREEGEIFEDEEEGGEGTVLAVEADSEVESGEIKMEIEAPLAKKSPSYVEDPISDNNVGNLNAENDMNILKNCFVKENDRDGSFLFETTEDTPKHIGEYGDLAGCEARKKSKLSNKISEKEKHKDIDVNDIRHRERSRSPASRESSYLLKHSDKDDHHTAEKVKSNPKFEQEEDKKGGSVINNGCISPRISKEKNRETAQSSSSSKYCIEVSNRDQSLSDDHISGRLSNQVQGHDAEESIPLRQSERQIKGRNSSDHERSGELDRLDRYTGRDREVVKEAHNERDYSVYSRHDGHNSRHSSRDRGTAGVNRRHGSRERGKEVGRSFSGYRDRDNQQIDKGALRDRERNHSSSRYDEREDRHENRGRELDRGRERDKYSNRDREREREIDRSRDLFSESDMIRNVKGERERERDGTNRDKSQIMDRKTHSLEDRERVDQFERDRSSNHNRYRDSRQSKYNDKERWKERTKSNEFSKLSTCNIHGSEEEKKNYLREEDDDYQGRIEQQLAKQDEEDIEKIKEESRRRRQAILEKYKQQQKQQHMEPPPKTHDKEELISIVKDGMHQVHKTIDGVDTTALEELVEQHDPLDAYAVDPSFIVGKSPVLNGLSVPEMAATAGVLGEGSPKSERSTDMFCDDIFGDSPAAIRKSGKDDFVKVDRSGFNDNWDDAEGYYSYRLGELLDGRYEVIAAHGKGVFSTVVRAKDLKPEKGDLEEVAIKIIRSNDTMYKAGMEELVILKKLTGADPEDRRHCVRLTAVRTYAKQLFIALKHLRNCGILHCDIKPDNMLVNEAKNVLKLCDFGNAMFAGKNEITPYLVSRFYRAPEIILGLPYDHPLDIWSVGCCLFEVYTGKVLFPGPSNNDMLRLQMELKGPFPKKMLRKGAFMDQHFDQDLNFHATEEDPVSKKTVKRQLLNIKPKDIGTLISGSPGEDPKMLANFKDLLERIFVLDPEKRMTISQALSHPFITGK